MPDYTVFKDYTVSFPQEYVAHVEIDRPRKLNSISPEMWPTLSAIFTTLATDPNVRAIVLSGAGDRAFTAGLDVQSASTSGPLAGGSSAAADPARKAFELYPFITAIQATVTSITQCLKPTIVVLHGIAYGAAVDIATAADMRIASRDVRISVKEVDIGLAADVGTLTRLPKAGVPLGWVKEVAFTAREFGAEEAARVGFVGPRIAENKAEGVRMALEMAGVIAGKSPVAVQGTKRLVDFSVDHTVQEGLDYTAVWNAGMLQTEDVGRAMLSGLKKGGKAVRFEKL